VFSITFCVGLRVRRIPLERILAIETLDRKDRVSFNRFKGIKKEVSIILKNIVSFSLV